MAEPGPQRGRLSSLLPHLVAIVAVLCSAAVAITVPFIDSGLERDRLEWQTGEAKREEFRELLDASVLRLWQAREFMFDVRLEEGRISRARRSQFAAEALLNYEKVYEDGLRISLRVGNDAPVLQVHARASTLLAQLEAELSADVRRLPDDAPLPDPDLSAMDKEVTAFMVEARRYVGESSG